MPADGGVDEATAPAGVNADAMARADAINGLGDKVTNKAEVAGTDGYDC